MNQVKCLRGKRLNARGRVLNNIFYLFFFNSEKIPRNTPKIRSDMSYFYSFYPNTQSLDLVFFQT